MSVNSSGRKCITICCPLLFWASSLSIEKDWYNYDNDILQLQAALIVLDWSLSGFWLLQSQRYLSLISPDKHLPMASKFTSLRMLFCQSVTHQNQNQKKNTGSYTNIAPCKIIQRQSLIQDSTPWIPDFSCWISSGLDYLSGLSLIFQ